MLGRARDVVVVRRGEVKTELETVSSRVWLEADGVVRIVIKNGFEEKLAHAQENVAAVGKVAGGVRRPLLADPRQGKGIDRDARVYYTSLEGQNVICAIGLLASSPFSQVLGSFMGTLYAQTPIPFRLFSDEAQALAWLRAFVP